MGRVLMYPQHLGGPAAGQPCIDAAVSQALQSLRKSYLFNRLSPILNAHHTSVVRAPQVGRDRSSGQTPIGIRSRSIRWKKSSKQSQHSVFWLSWPHVTKAAKSKSLSQRPQFRSLLNRSLPASIINIALGRGPIPALTAAPVRGAC